MMIAVAATVAASVAYCVIEPPPFAVPDPAGAGPSSTAFKKEEPRLFAKASGSHPLPGQTCSAGPAWEPSLKTMDEGSFDQCVVWRERVNNRLTSEVCNGRIQEWLGNERSDRHMIQAGLRSPAEADPEDRRDTGTDRPRHLLGGEAARSVVAEIQREEICGSWRCDVTGPWPVRRISPGDFGGSDVHRCDSLVQVGPGWAALARNRQRWQWQATNQAQVPPVPNAAHRCIARRSTHLHAPPEFGVVPVVLRVSLGLLRRVRAQHHEGITTAGNENFRCCRVDGMPNGNRD